MTQTTDDPGGSVDRAAVGAASSWVNCGDALGTVSVLGEIVPTLYASFSSEYSAVESSAALLATPWERMLHIEGRDAAPFLHNLLTQDVRAITPSGVAPAALANRKGHLVADLWVTVASDGLRLRLPAPVVSPVLELLDHHRIMDQVEWSLDPDPAAAFLIVGPEAADHLTKLGGSFRHEVSESGPLPEIHEKAFWMAVREVSLADILVFVPPEAVPALRKRLTGTEPHLPEVGWDGFNLRRIEKGRAWIQLDVGGDRLVPEPGLGDRISYTKGCYLGQETLARLHYVGKLNWSLERFELEAPVEPGVDLVDASDERVGWLTSTSARPDAGPVALGYLHRKAREAPTELHTRDGIRVHPFGS